MVFFFKFRKGSVSDLAQFHNIPSSPYLFFKMILSFIFPLDAIMVKINIFFIVGIRYNESLTEIRKINLRRGWVQIF